MVAGIAVVLVAMVAGQRDVMRLGLLLAALPVIAAIIVSRARLRMSCERLIEPAQVPLGSPMKGQIILGQDGRLPAAILLLEDVVPRELGSRPRFLVDQGGSELAPGGGVSASRPGTGPVLHRAADRTAPPTRSGWSNSTGSSWRPAR